VEYILMYRI